MNPTFVFQEMMKHSAYIIHIKIKIVPYVVFTGNATMKSVRKPNGRFSIFEKLNWLPSGLNINTKPRNMEAIKVETKNRTATRNK
jgi:hypothetical protein